MSLSDCHSDGATGPSSGPGPAGRIQEQDVLDPPGSRTGFWLYDYSGPEGRVKVVHYNAKDSITDSSIELVNAFGNISRILRYSAVGTAIGHTDYSYDGNQILIADSVYGAGNVMYNYSTYVFSDGKKTRNDNYNTTGRSGYTTYEYDAAGLRIKSISRDTTGRPISYTTYGYSGGLMDTLRFYNPMDSLTQIHTFKMEREPSPMDYMKYGNW